MVGDGELGFKGGLGWFSKAYGLQAALRLFFCEGLKGCGRGFQV